MHIRVQFLPQNMASISFIPAICHNSFLNLMNQTEAVSNMIQTNVTMEKKQGNIGTMKSLQLNNFVGQKLMKTIR